MTYLVYDTAILPLTNTTFQCKIKHLGSKI